MNSNAQNQQPTMNATSNETQSSKPSVAASDSSGTKLTKKKTYSCAVCGKDKLNQFSSKPIGKKRYCKECFAEKKAADALAAAPEDAPINKAIKSGMSDKEAVAAWTSMETSQAIDETDKLQNEVEEMAEEASDSESVSEASTKDLEEAPELTLRFGDASCPRDAYIMKFHSDMLTDFGDDMTRELASVFLTNPPKLERDTMEQAKHREEQARRLQEIANTMIKDGQNMLALAQKHIALNTNCMENLDPVKINERTAARDAMMQVVAMGLMTMEQMEKTLDEKFNPPPKTTKKTTKRVRTKITKKSGQGERRGAWTVEPLPRFKILSSYVDKKTTAFEVKLDDGRYATFNPRFAHIHNDEFRRWFDDTNTSNSGIKFDTGTKKNGQEPASWKGMRVGVDYQITDDKLLDGDLDELWGEREMTYSQLPNGTVFVR